MVLNEIPNVCLYICLSLCSYFRKEQMRGLAPISKHKCALRKCFYMCIDDIQWLMVEKIKVLRLSY